MGTELMAQVGANRITADDINNYAPPVQVNKAGREAELNEARMKKLEAGEIIQDFTSRRFAGKKFRLLQRKKGEKIELIIQTLEPNRKIREMVVEQFDRPVSEGQFAYGSPLVTKLKRAFAAINSEANKTQGQKANSGNAWDAGVGFAVDAVMSLPETIAGVPEGLVRSGSALIGDLTALAEVGASALPGVSVPETGRSNLLNRERRAQYSEKNASQEAVTGIGVSLARALGADPSTPAYQVGRALGVLTPLVGKARGRLARRGKVPDVNVQNIRTVKTAIEQTPVTTIAREVGKWTPENAALLRKNTPEIYRALETKLANARQTAEVQTALGRLRGQKTTTTPRQSELVRTPQTDGLPPRSVIRQPRFPDQTQIPRTSTELQARIVDRVTPPGDTPPQAFAPSPAVAQRAVELNRSEGIDTAIVIRADVPLKGIAEPVTVDLLYTGLNPNMLKSRLGEFLDGLEDTGIKVLNRDTILAEAGLSKKSLDRRAKLYGDGPVKRSPEDNLLEFAKEKYGAELAPRVASELAEIYSAEGPTKPGVEKWISSLEESQRLLTEMELRILEELIEEYARATVANFGRPDSTVASFSDAIRAQIAKDIKNGVIPNTLQAKVKFVLNLDGNGLMDSKVGRSLAEKGGLVEPATTASAETPKNASGDNPPPRFGITEPTASVPPGGQLPPNTPTAPPNQPVAPDQNALPPAGDTTSRASGRPVNPSEVTVVRGNQPPEPVAPESTAPVRIMPELTLKRSDLRVVTADAVTPGQPNPFMGLINASTGADGKVQPQQFILRSPKPKKPGEFSERLVTITSGDKLDAADLRQLRATVISGNTATYTTRQRADISQKLQQAEVIVTVQNMKAGAGDTVTTKGFPATASVRTGVYPGTSYVQFVVGGNGMTSPARVDAPRPGTPALKPEGVEKLGYSVPGGATQATGILIDVMQDLGFPPSAYYNTRPGERTPASRVIDIYRDLTQGAETFEGMLPDLRVRNYIIQRNSNGDFPPGYRPPNPVTGENAQFGGEEVLPVPSSDPIENGGVPIRPQRQILPNIEDLFRGQGRKAPPIGQNGVTKDTYTPGTSRIQTPGTESGTPVDPKPFSEITPNDIPKSVIDRVDDVKLGRRYVDGVGSAIYKQRVERPVFNRVVRPATNSYVGQLVIQNAEKLARRADAVGQRFAQTPAGKVIVALNNKTIGNPKFWEGIEKLDAGVDRTIKVAGAATITTLSVAAANGKLITGTATAGDANLTDIEKKVSKTLNFAKGTRFTYYYADVPGMEKVGGRAFVAMGAAPKAVLLPPTQLGQSAVATPWIGPNNGTQRLTATRTGVAAGPTAFYGGSFGTQNMNLSYGGNASIGRVGANAPRLDIGKTPAGNQNPVDLSVLVTADWASQGSLAKFNAGPVAVILQRQRDPVSPKTTLSTSGSSINPTGQGRTSAIQPVLTMNTGYDPNAKDVTEMGKFIKWLESEVDKIKNNAPDSSNPTP